MDEIKRFTDVSFNKLRHRIFIEVKQAGGHFISIEAAVELRNELNIAIEEGNYYEGRGDGIELARLEMQDK